VFTRPRAAFVGLAQRPTFLFPLVVTLLLGVLQVAVLYQPAIVPMQLQQMQRQVDEGKMPAEALQRAEPFMRGPVGMTMALVATAVAIPVMSLVIAALMLIAVRFVLAGPLSFRQAWSLTWWAGLISLVQVVLVAVIALSTSTFPVHLGLGVLNPAEQATSRAGYALGAFLDAFNPVSAWWIGVSAVGAAVVSGKSVKSLAVVFTIFYLVICLMGAGLGSLTARVGG
jgi:hypothetical protein